MPRFPLATKPPVRDNTRTGDAKEGLAAEERRVRAGGEEVHTSHRAIGLGFDGLKQGAADRERDVILVCGGDPFRIKPLQVALRAGLANVRVGCTATAAVLVGEERLPESAGPP